jgi:membrane protein
VEVLCCSFGFFRGLDCDLCQDGGQRSGFQSGNGDTDYRYFVHCLGVVLLWGREESIRELSRRAILFLVLSGVTTGLSWLFYFKALQSGPVSKVAPVDKLSVAMAMLLAFFLLRETPDVKTIVGGLLIVAGSVVILF